MQEFEPEEPKAFDEGKVVEALEKLIDTCRDGEAGFRDAAEHVGDNELRGYFVERSRERGEFAQQLERELERLGRWQTTRQGSVTGTLHRTWFDLKRALGGGDQTILESVEGGEDTARNAYQNALQEPLPEATLAMIRSQAQSVMASHDHVRLLRDRRRAA